MALQTELAKRLMKEKDYTQRELAEMCSVTESAMSRYLAGSREPDYDTLADMAVALGTTIDELVGKTSPEDALEDAIRIVARNVDKITPQIKAKLQGIIGQCKSGRQNARRKE